MAITGIGVVCPLGDRIGQFHSALCDGHARFSSPTLFDTQGLPCQLSGEVEGTLDGKWYRAQAGDVLWTSVGCVHTFVNTSREPVRWLETFSPQPPKENVFRFVAEWQKRARELEGAS